MRRLRGSSADALLLTFAKLVTVMLGLAVTRLLSQNLSKHDYGTYSQVLLIVSTVSSMTILGMADGVNYFHCSRQGDERESYLSTIYCLQCMISTLAGAAVMLLAVPLCKYFGNADIKRLLIYGATIPLFQNLLSITQVLLVSVGKARLLAVRNLTVSLVRLASVIVVITVAKDVAVVLATTLAMDLAQMLLFVLVLWKNGCALRPKRVDFKLFGTIFAYCAPMAVYTLLNTLSRDCDKYLISLMTDTETLAMYANASKVLPFDVITASFVTVLLPRITRHIANGEREQTVGLYRTFLEITYISTTILCCAVLASSPQVMQLLYSKKYLDGIRIFCIYVLVDLLRFTNITLILSAAGKTKRLMYYSVATLAANAAANILLYWLLGVIGPAVATLLTSLGFGLCLMRTSAKELDSPLRGFFDLKHLVGFMSLNALLTVGFYLLQRWLGTMNVSYLAILAITAGGYVAVAGLCSAKRFLRALKQVDT